MDADVYKRQAEQQVTDGAMEAKIKGIDNAGYWVIPEDGQYRVAVSYTHLIAIFL